LVESQLETAVPPEAILDCFVTDDKQEIVVNLQMLRGRVVLEERVGMSPEAQAFRDARPVLPLNPRPTTTPPERGSSLGQ